MSSSAAYLLRVLSEVYDNIKELIGRDTIGLRAYLEQNLEMFNW
jgi:hypothetical protein